MSLLDAERAITWPSPRRLVISASSATLEARKRDLREEASEWLEEAREISDHMRVRRGRYLVTDNRKRRNNKKVLNEKAIFASRICGAGMLAGVSSPSRPWMKLATPDRDLNEFAAVKRWLDTVEKQLYRVFAVSNYYH